MPQYLGAAKATRASSHVIKDNVDNVALPDYCFKIISILYSTAKNTHECKKDIKTLTISMSRLHEKLTAFPSLPSVISLYH